MFLPTRAPAEPLPEVPSPLERRAYDPVVIQRHLSLWDSLHFTDKVSDRWQAPACCDSYYIIYKIYSN